MRPFAIAAIQMLVEPTGGNLDRMRQRIEFVSAVYPWVQLVLFSELAAFGPLKSYAEPMPGPTEQFFCDLARRHGLWIVPGSMYEKVGDKVYNTAPVIDPNGVVVARHRKIFPFTPYEEGVEPGDSFVTFDIPDIGRFGLTICYDMWFPETTRTLACMGCEVLLHPSLTPTIDRDVELSIGRANAAMNQMFLIDVNGVGAGGIGQSQIISPGGEIMHLAGRNEEIIPIEIDLDRVRRSRAVGLRSLGQVLKSFRDRKVEFPAYPSTPENTHFLNTLGPLEKPHRGSLAGLRVCEDVPEIQHADPAAAARAAAAAAARPHSQEELVTPPRPLDQHTTIPEEPLQPPAHDAPVSVHPHAPQPVASPKPGSPGPDDSRPGPT
jgi:predicted amidohydrolase